MRVGDGDECAWKALETVVIRLMVKSRVMLRPGHDEVKICKIYELSDNVRNGVRGLPELLKFEARIGWVADYILKKLKSFHAFHHRRWDHRLVGIIHDDWS